MLTVVVNLIVYMSLSHGSSLPHYSDGLHQMDLLTGPWSTCKEYRYYSEIDGSGKRSVDLKGGARILRTHRINPSADFDHCLGTIALGRQLTNRTAMTLPSRLRRWPASSFAAF